MAAQRQVAVLGLGRFGSAVARELARIGHAVLAVDANERAVQAVSGAVTHAVQADITDVDALRGLGVADLDAVIVALSSDIEVSILATVQLRQLGARRIIAKAASELHGSILAQVGASHVVYPELETGLRVAHSFAAPAVRDYLDAAPGYGFARIRVPDEVAGRTLADLDLRRIRVTPMAHFRKGTVTLNPVPSLPLQPGDELIVAGADEDLERLPGAAASPGA